MKKVIYAVRDVKANVFANPFVAPNAPVALRDFAYAANDKTSAIGRNPEDFFLYELGMYDDESGLIEVFATPQHVGTADQYVEKQ